MYQISLKSDKLFEDVRTYGRTDVPTDGRTFSPLMLLGRLGGVDLIKCRPRESNPDTVTHPSTNRAQRMLTSLNETNALALLQTATNTSSYHYTLFTTISLYYTPPLRLTISPMMRARLQHKVLFFIWYHNVSLPHYHITISSHNAYTVIP